MRQLGALLALMAALITTAGAMCVGWMVQPLVRPQPPQAMSAVDPAQLERHVRALSEQFFPRSFDHPAHLDAAADHVRDELRGAGATVREQAYLHEGLRWRNLSARFGPERGALLVIGAHYDSHADAPQRALDESQPLAQTHTPGADEMIGFFNDAPHSQHYPLPGLERIYLGQGDFIAVVGRLQDVAPTRALKAWMRGASPLPVHSINAPASLVGVDFSDHLSYWEQGYPALMVTDTAFFRNAAYHQAGDTAERLDYRRMAQVVQAVAAFALRPAGP